MDFVRSVRAYLGNLPTALAFALLLIFVLPFAWLSNAIVSSGTVLIGYGFLKQPLLETALLLALSLAFLFFYSILVCIMVLAVRRDLSSLKTNYYMREKIRKFGFKYFKFLAAFTVISAVAASLLLDAGVPLIAVNFVLVVISISFLFLPQTLVVDEEGLAASVLTNWEFMLKNPGVFIFVALFGTLAVLLLQLLEFALDYFFFGGNYISLLLALVILVPFFEALKTQAYMERFSLIQRYESFASR